MRENLGNKIQIIVSYAVYVLSGFLIFSPLHKSENIPLSLLCAVTIAFFTLWIILRLYSSKSNIKKSGSVLCAVISIIASLSALFASLMLITEIIRDVAYIANRGVSLVYYTFTALIILLVSLYLCTSLDKGVYRFTTLSSLVFAFLFIVIFFSLTTTKGIITDFSAKSSSLFSPILLGIRAGLFYTADTSVFLFCFKNLIKDEKGNFPQRQIFLGFVISFTFIIIYNLFTILIFGRLTSEISDPDYALIKLVRGIDLTEIISAVRIISFLIKSSSYIFLSSECLKTAFPKIKLSQRHIISILYAMIPTTFLILAMLDKSLKYGAFQHLIYPVTALMSFCFMLVYSSIQKKNM